MNCVVDTSNIFFIVFSKFVRTLKEDNNNNEYVVEEKDLGLFFHLFISKVLEIMREYSNCIFCFEGINSTAWRKSIYPKYKGNRNHDNDPNYKYVRELLQTCKEILSNLNNTQVIEVENCEADDCIYQVCKMYAERNEEIVIISNDRDLSQIINLYPLNVKQFDPKKTEYVQPNSNILLQKAIVGDPSDNINVFKGIGPKTFEKMLNDQEFFDKKMPPDNIKKLKEIMQIIDLRLYPDEYQNNIITELNKPFNSVNNEYIKKFFEKYNLKKLQEDWKN